MKKLLCLILGLCLLAGCAAAPEPPAKPSGPVLTCGDYRMDSDQFQYYFGYQYAAILDTYGDSAFDPSQDLAGQSYDDSQSWADFLTDQALTLAEQTEQLCLAAKAAGFSIPEATESADLPAITDEVAREQGYADARAYLTAFYGEGANLEGYRVFLHDMLTASAYSEHMNTSLTYTDDEVEAFYDSRAADYADVFDLPKNYDRLLDVRIIRFYPDDPGSMDDWFDAEARANAALDAYRADPSDAAFADLADSRTEDFNAPDGGLYTEVHPGTFPALDGWLFPKDTLRMPGDFDLAREDDAWALCCISAAGDRPIWRIVAEQDLRYADYFNAFTELKQTYVFERHPENIELRAPTAHNAKNELPEGIEAVG